MRKRELRQKLAEYSREIRRLSRVVEERNRDLFVVELRRQTAEDNATELTKLVTKVAEQLGRQPEIVVESILTGITPLFLGYNNPPDRETLDKILNNATPEEDPPTQYPSHEFDPFLESEDSWPDPTTMATTSSQRTSTENGLASKRPPGETPFTSGSGATHPPGNAVE